MTKLMFLTVALMLGAGCGGSSDPAPPAPNRRVFVTSTGYDGIQVSLAFADGVCATAAQAALLGGTWKAWLSAPGVNAIDRIADVGPWFRPDGQKAFNNKANLGTTPLVPINVDELGHTGISTFVWTGTQTGGTAGDACWNGSGVTTATYGVTNSTTFWTSNGIYDCGSANGRLYCFEQ